MIKATFCAVALKSAAVKVDRRPHTHHVLVLPLAMVLLLTTACAPGGRSTTTVSVTLPACPVQLPADWKKARTDARVDPGQALAMGPDGEIIALRGREVLLVGSDASVSTVYTIPDPALETVRFAALDHDRIVLGFDEPGVSGLKVRLKRVAVIERGDGSTRTIAESTDADYQARRNVVDSVAIFDGKAYWITEGADPFVDGILRSYDFATANTTEVESGYMYDLRATATGLVWTSGSDERSRPVFLGLAPLPPALASIVGMNDDQTSLVRNGDAYAWVTGVADGGTGIARWSPENGLTRISTLRLFDDVFEPQPPLRLAGPYVVLDRGNDDPSELIDTRSGALTLIDLDTVGAANDSIAYSVRGAGGRPEAVGSLRTEGLSSLACPSTAPGGDAAQQACEVSTPGNWRRAFGGSARVETVVSTGVLAVGPGGDIVAGLHHHSRPLVLIDNDKDATVTYSKYTIANPDSESIRFASLDERWIVVGVGPIQPVPELTRIDVIDRSNGSVRTIVTPARTTLPSNGDSLAVFKGTLYWTAGDGDDTTTVHSYDLATGRTADIATSRSIDDLRATPTGIAWTEGGHGATPVVHVHNLTELPAPVRSAGAEPTRDAITTDGDAYAWRTRAGIAHWSPSTGVKRISMILHEGGHAPSQIKVVGPYVLWPEHGVVAILDTRSGAITSVEASIGGTGGGNATFVIPANAHHPAQVGRVRLADLPPLTC